MEKTKNVWEKYPTAAKQKQLMAFSEGYKKFMNAAKTEREAVDETIQLARKAGFKEFKEIKKIKAGDKIYFNNRGKSIALFVIGKEPLEDGLNILGAHIDSPRIDLKQNPLYEDNGLVLMDTHYYGGIKKYQWVTIPLAIHGVVVKKDGSTVDVVIGEAADDPILYISDLLIHLAADQMDKKARVVIEGEDLDLLIGSRPLLKKDGEEKEAAADQGKKTQDGEAVGETKKDQAQEKEAVKAGILQILKEKYGMEEDDFLSAELEIVPAYPARDCGLDRSMIAAYGQDDRVCAYTSLIALLESEAQEYTGCCLLVDKEEIGSVGATGMHSRFFENTMAELMNVQGEYSELALRRALKNCRMLSSDVSAGFDPLYASTFEKKNAALVGYGLVFNKFTGSRGKNGSNDANAEYVAWVRNVMEEGKVAFQTAELGRVDLGGGGTIAYISAVYNMEVIDSGVAVLSMHAPMEVTSKADVFEAKKGYAAFLKA